MLFHLSMSFEFHAFHMTFSMLLENHHVMEITIGHSNYTSYVNFLVQKCMFEHKYDMDWKQSKVHTYWIENIYTYVQPSLLKQSTKKHKIFKVFCMHQVYKIALFAWVPHMGLKTTLQQWRSWGPMDLPSPLDSVEPIWDLLVS